MTNLTDAFRNSANAPKNCSVSLDTGHYVTIRHSVLPGKMVMIAFHFIMCVFMDVP